MRGRTGFQLIWLVSALMWGCEAPPNVRVTAAPGVSIPNAGDLARKLDGSLSGSGIKMYVKESGRLIEVKPSRITRPLSAVVRSFDAKTGVAYVDVLEYAEYKMPVFQVWRFDGKAWSDSVDPGIFVR